MGSPPDYLQFGQGSLVGLKRYPKEFDGKDGRPWNGWSRSVVGLDAALNTRMRP